jgi:hypothetical protein
MASFRLLGAFLLLVTLPVALVATTLAFSTGCAKTDWIDRTLVTVDVTGTLTGSMAGAGSGGRPPELLFDLEQQGSTVKGTMRFPAGGSSEWVTTSSRVIPGPIDGMVTGDVFRFRLTSGRLAGEMTVSGDEMTGQVSWSGGRTLSTACRSTLSPGFAAPVSQLRHVPHSLAPGSQTVSWNTQ